MAALYPLCSAQTVCEQTPGAGHKRWGPHGSGVTLQELKNPEVPRATGDSGHAERATAHGTRCKGRLCPRGAGLGCEQGLWPGSAAPQHTRCQPPPARLWAKLTQTGSV